MKIVFKLLVTFVLILESIRAQNFENGIKISVDFVEKFRSKEIPSGLGVGINYKGKHIWLHNTGYSDVENGVPFSKDSVIRTGSVSKAIEGALVAKLIEQNKINLDSDIHKYVSEQHFPKKKWNGQVVNITVRQLLTMTAGIRSSVETRDFRHLPTAQNVADTLSYFASDPLLAKPGTKFIYSNWGWHLIGAIMESVSGQDFEQLMHKMFAELHMNSSRLSRRELLIPHRCRPYTRSLSADKKHYVLHSAAAIEDMGRPLPWLPMGAVITGVPDLLTFTDVMLKCYKSDGFLKASTVRQLWTTHMNGYGMGWYIGKYTLPKNKTKTMKYIHYLGSVAGSVNTIAVIPELDISVALVANMGGINLETTALTLLNNFVNNL